jgi:DNA processing protein
MTRLEALVSLNMVTDIGSIRLKKLLESFDQPEDILKSPQEKLIRVCGIGEKIASRICSLKKEDLDKEFALAKKYGLKIITQEDKDYPENLKNIYDPPIVLYIKGELKERDKISIAIVGSRRASFYGLCCAENFAGDLSHRGWVIVSGMARGIDTYAHKGALKQKARTIAVMGSGFKHIYPPENKELVEEIAKDGAVISEFPINTEPLKQNFPCRNRVISGLSLGVLVVEAARNSGALITADFALEQGREVFALPGKVDSGTSFGTNELIKQGAKLVSCVEDILEEFNLVNTEKTFLNEDLRRSMVRLRPSINGSTSSPSLELSRAKSKDSRTIVPSEVDGSTVLTIDTERSRSVEGRSPLTLSEVEGSNADLRRFCSQEDLRPSACNPRAPALKCNLKSDLSDEESYLYSLVSHQPISLDEIVEKTNMSIQTISGMLLRLQIKKLIRQLPGKEFIRKEYER